MAEVSSAILNDALANVAKILVDDSPDFDHYGGMGAGEDNTGAVATQHDLLGSETHYDDVAGAYEASYKATWQNTFSYGDLTSHVYKELVICQDNANHLNLCLCRFTYDAITLGAGETLTFTVKVTVQQGS